MYIQPRFVAYAFYPRYGSRDEFLCLEGYFIAVAETELWLHKLIDRVVDPEDSEVLIKITDNAPRSAWSPEIAEERKRKLEDERYLPF